MSMCYLIIIFTLVIAVCIYVYWGQSDDFCFALVLALLSTVLYIVTLSDEKSFTMERFAQGPTESTDQKGGGASGINIAAFKKLADLKEDTIKILQPRFESMIAAFKGTAKVEQEQKYDDEGNEVEVKVADEVPVDKGAEKEIRAVNKFLKDLKSFDPGYYFTLLGLATGKKDPVVEEEFPIT